MRAIKSRPIKASKYTGIHNWLKCHYGKAEKCENLTCTSIAPRRFEWALLKGKAYEKDRDNYIQLCPSCHRKYDYKEETREKQRELSIGRTFSEETRKKIGEAGKGRKSYPIQQIEVGSETVIANYSGIPDASEKTGLSNSTLSSAIRGKSKTAGGYIWRRVNAN